MNNQELNDVAKVKLLKVTVMFINDILKTHDEFGIDLKELLILQRKVLEDKISKQAVQENESN